MKRWTFSCGDFERLRLHRDDFVYADPPYDVPFTTYASGGFAWEDQVRAARWLARHPGPVVLTNQATDRIMALYAELGFDCRACSRPRVGSAAPATGKPLPRCWRRGTWEAAKPQPSICVNLIS